MYGSPAKRDFISFTVAEDSSTYDNSKVKRRQSCWRVWKRLSRLQQRIVIMMVIMCTLCGVYIFPNLLHGDRPPSKADRASLNRIHRIEDMQQDALKLNVDDPADAEFKTKAKEHLENIKKRPNKRGPPVVKQDSQDADNKVSNRDKDFQVHPHLRIAREREEEEMREHEFVGGVDTEEKLKAEPLNQDDDQDWGQEVGAAAGALEDNQENDEQEGVVVHEDNLVHEDKAVHEDNVLHEDTVLHEDNEAPNPPPNHEEHVMYGPQNEKQQAVVDAFKHAWKAYRLHAWGHDELKPISKTYSEWFTLGLTLIDSLDTIYIMGLEKEFQEARDWVANEMDVKPNKDVNLFETTIRVLGGLLSIYHLSGDPVFLEKAKILGDSLLPCFNTGSKVPYSDVNLKSGKAHPPRWGPDSTVSEVTSIQIEFRELSFATKDPKYKDAADGVMRHLHSLPKQNGLVPIFINANSGQFRKHSTITMGARGDSYYEYLIKQWLQTGKTEKAFLDDYLAAVNGMQDKLIRKSGPNQLTFVGELLSGNKFSPKMDHLVCFLPGALALGYMNGLDSSHLDLARELMHTCYQMYAQMPTFLSPEIAHFNMLPGAKEDIIVKPADAHNLLRPETVESLFYLHRITGDKVYRDWGWQIFHAFEKHTKIPAGGYSSISNVKNVEKPSFRDKMESFFLGETLKYFYLLFSDDQNLLPLNKYVFNTEAHPLPIRNNVASSWR